MRELALGLKEENRNQTTTNGEERARTSREERSLEQNLSMTLLRKIKFAASQSEKAANVHDTS